MFFFFTLITDKTKSLAANKQFFFLKLFLTFLKMQLNAVYCIVYKCNKHLTTSVTVGVQNSTMIGGSTWDEWESSKATNTGPN